MFSTGVGGTPIVFRLTTQSESVEVQDFPGMPSIALAPLSVVGKHQGGGACSGSSVEEPLFARAVRPTGGRSNRVVRIAP
jgi:hypothetical protein